MFWIGLIIGTMLGAMLGISLIAIFAIGKECETNFNNFKPDEYDDFTDFETEIEKEWLERGVTKNGR